MDRLEAMAAFVAVAEQRGFAAAARKLERAPSAVTRLVAALEDHLALRLFRRTTRRVALTESGARYLERARRILLAVDEAEAAVRAERSEPSGRLVVSAPLVFGRLHVAPLFCAFLARHPKVEGELALSDRRVSLVDDGVDVAVRIGALEDSSLIVRKVGETRRVLVAAPSYLARHRRPRAPKDLAGQSLIHFTPLAPLPEWRFHRRGREERVALRPAFTTNSADAAVGHAELGGGIALVLGYQVRDAVRAGRLEILLPRCEPPPLPIQLVHASGRLVPPGVRAFMELVRETADWRFTAL